MSAVTRTKCPHCHHQGSIAQELKPGTKIRCASCRKPFVYEPQHGLDGAELGVEEPVMGTPTMMECPHCHRRGTTSQKLRPAVKIRCPACRKPFTYQPQSEVESADEFDQRSPLPEPPPRRGVGGLSVFSQTELVQPASEATVAEALAESRGSDKRNLFIGVGVIGASVLVGLCLLSVRDPSERLGPQGARTAIKAPLDSDRNDPSLTETKAWEGAIEEALIPGITPVSDGVGREEWNTGQALPVKGGSSIDDASWRIFKCDQPGFERRVQFLYLRLDKKVSLDVLRLITARVLLQASPGYDTTWVIFYTAWALGESKRETTEPLDLTKVYSWANSRMDLTPKPKLYVRIFGLTVKDETNLNTMPFPPGAKVIGSWIEENMGGRVTIYRDSDEQLHLEDVYVFQVKPEYEELIEVPSSDGRRFELKRLDDEVNYFLIEDGGDLQTRCKDGIVYKAQAIR